MSGWASVTANPFAQQAASNPAPARTSSNNNAWGSDVPLDDESPKKSFPNTNISWANAVAASKPAASTNGSYKTSFSGYTAAELSAKAQELEAREEAVRRREAEIMKLGSRTGNKNWPFFFPIVYHDINAEIPVWNRSMVRWAYRVWLLSAFGFLVNWVVIMVMAFASKADWSSFFIATIATGAGLPLSFFLWYRRLYYAAQSDGSLYKYLTFLMFAFLHLAWCIWVVLAVPNIGRSCAGLFHYMFKLFGQGGDSYIYAIMCAINVGVWVLAAIGTKVVVARGVMALRSHDRPRLDYERRTGHAYIPGTV